MKHMACHTNVSDSAYKSGLYQFMIQTAFDLLRRPSLHPLILSIPLPGHSPEAGQSRGHPTSGFPFYKNRKPWNVL